MMTLRSSRLNAVWILVYSGPNIGHLFPRCCFCVRPAPPLPCVLDGEDRVRVYRFCQTVMLRSRFAVVCPSCDLPQHALIGDGTPLAHHHLVEARRGLVAFDALPEHHGPRLLRGGLINPARPVPVDAYIPGEVRTIGRRERNGGDHLPAHLSQAMEPDHRLPVVAA